ncbi:MULTISPECIES: type IV pilin protein [Cupriavidus]|uniref:Type IV pilin protein n=1 Tax=Cupriavidus pauculus TaxID=82633 RepID=A0A3G8GZQ7_9BURK|nr:MULTISPECIES: type IV pilin protein [Cupriavidus]AZG13664.1 type IV pilin protein [Cupriavidus pauculus]MDT6960303.1 type IV pilin protein [Cupriavidus sp. SZY C1]
MHTRLRGRQAGFTLMELMVTVTVIGILAAIAYPSYQEFIRKGRRTEAKAALMENMQLFERHFSQVNTYYAAGTTVTWDGYKKYSGDNPTGAKYTISAIPCTGAGTPNDGQCVELRAKPNAGFDDPTCDALVLRSTNEKLVAIGSTAPKSVPNCW